MKYNININQLALNEQSKNMDVVDAAILDYLTVICKSSNEKVDSKRTIDKDGCSWTWIDLQSLIDEMPLLRISSKTAISTRIQKIEKDGFISILKKRIQGHVRLYVKLDRKIDLLYVKLDRKESLLVKLDTPTRETGQESQKPTRETGPIIILTSNHNTNDTNTRELFEKFWNEYPTKRAKKPTESIWFKKINPELAEFIIEDVKKRKVSDKHWLKGFIPNPTTYLNQERWNDEIAQIKSSNLNSNMPYTKGKYKDDQSVSINT